MDGEELGARQLDGISGIECQRDISRARRRTPSGGLVGVTIGHQNQHLMRGGTVWPNQLGLADVHSRLQIGVDGAAAGGGRRIGGGVETACRTAAAVRGRREAVGHALNNGRRRRGGVSTGASTELTDANARRRRARREVAQQRLGGRVLVRQVAGAHAARAIQHDNDVGINPSVTVRRGGRCWRACRYSCRGDGRCAG